MSNFDHLMGWKNKPEEVHAIMAQIPFPVFSDIYGPLKDTGRGKTQFLYKFVEKVVGEYYTYHQTIGDCVSMGAACAINAVKACQMLINDDFSEWEGITSTEDIYAGSRVIIGNGSLGYSDGSAGVWAAAFVSTYGTLVRKKYGDIDLTVYDGLRAREWGKPENGPPKELLPYEKEHTVKTISQVRTYEEARDAIFNLYPVTVASSQGFSMTRDQDGFLVPQGTWEHQQCFIACDDSFRRPGLFLMNSWGENCYQGPVRNEAPSGGGWVDADTVNVMLNSRDSWAYSNFEGFQPQTISLRIV